MDLSKFKLIDETRQFSNLIWEEVISWGYFEKDTVGKQLVRAADSISANLSEAHGRYSFADRRRFGYYARGSLCETITWLSFSVTRGLIEPADENVLQIKLQVLSKQINAYINRLK